MYFDKYDKLGAYHWQEFKDRNTHYSKHARHVKEWVRAGRTLDIGAGDGLITSMIRDCTGIDDNKKAVSLAQERKARVMEGSAYKLPFLSESYDNILLLDVIEHLETPDKCLNECFRVLKGFGMLYITTPPKKKSGKLQDPLHYKEYTVKELIEYVESFGFKLNGKTDEMNYRIYAKFLKP